MSSRAKQTFLKNPKTLLHDMKLSYSVLAVDEEPVMEKPQSLIGEVMP